MIKQIRNFVNTTTKQTKGKSRTSRSASRQKQPDSIDLTPDEWSDVLPKTSSKKPGTPKKQSAPSSQNQGWDTAAANVNKKPETQLVPVTQKQPLPVPQPKKRATLGDWGNAAMNVAAGAGIASMIPMSASSSTQTDIERMQRYQPDRERRYS